MRALILIAGASARPRRLRRTTTRPTTRRISTRIDRGEHRLQRRDRDRRGDRRRGQHGRRRRIYNEIADDEPRQQRAITTAPAKPGQAAPSRRATAGRATHRSRGNTRRQRDRIGSGQPDHLVRLKAQAPFRAAPSPARSPPRPPPRASSQSIGWTRKWSKSQLSSSAGSIPACGHTSFSSSPERWTTSVPAFGLTQIQSMPGRRRQAFRWSRPQLGSRAREAHRSAPRRAAASARRR